MATFTARISGNPNVKTLASVNVRAQPSTATGIAVLFQAKIGTASLAILDVQPDQSFNGFNGKVYQWFKLRFASAQTGWVRDDLMSILGDGSNFGYPNLTQEAYAFGLLRQLVPTNYVPTPTPVPTPDPPPPPTPDPNPVPTPSVDVIGTVISKEGLNMRETPVNGKIKAKLAYHSQAKLLAAQPQAGTTFHWAQVQTPQGRGWVRTDFLSINGDASGFGLSKGDEFPAPLQNYWYVRGQNDVQANGSIDKHLGWDFGASPTEPIRCGPNGGTVIRLMTCTRCTASKPNVISQGIPLDSPAVLNDAAWGFGYGNAVIVRYTNDILPVSTQQRLAALNLAGAHLFAIYAHLSVVSVTVNQILMPFAQVGVIGNTGNSTATHLHLEVRASKNKNDTFWGGLTEFDPEILFLR